MIPYVISAGIGCFFTYLDSVQFRKRHRIGFCGAIAILIPCLLAGFRDIGVGTDTSVYGMVTFQTACSYNNLVDFMVSKHWSVTAVEPLYRMFVFLITRVTTKIFWQFFLIEFVIMLFTYCAIVESDIGRYSWIGMFVCHTLFFCFSLNAMRQAMAMAVILWGFKYIRNKQFKKYALVVFVATLLHLMSVVAIAFYVIYILCVPERRERTVQKASRMKSFVRRYHSFIISIMLICACFVVLFGKNLILIMARLKSTYAYQINHMNESFDLNFFNLIFMCLLCLPFMLIWMKRNNRNSVNVYYFTMMMLATILWQLCGISPQMFRISMYLWYLIVLAVPEIIKSLKNIDNKHIITFYYVVLCSMYYIYTYVIYNSGETYPYTSDILGIY